MIHTSVSTRFIYGKILIFLLFITNHIFAQESNWNFRNLSVKDGLSYNTITAIEQDSKGRMWIGTTDGLNLYDGHQFKVFRYEKGNNGGILNSRINSINKAPDGNSIWICTDNGIEIYNCELDKFIHLNDLLGADTEKIFGYVSSLTFDNDSTVWIGTGNGLFRLDRKTYELKVVRSITDQTITKVFADSKNELWILYESLGVARYDRKNDKFILYKSYIQGYKPVDVNTARTIYEDKRGTIWVGTDWGLAYIDEKKQTMFLFEYDPKNSKGPNKGSVSSILEDNRNTFWVGFQYGLTIYDRDKNEFFHIKNQPSNAKSISGDEVDCILQDNQGSIWFGMFSSGLSIYDYAQSQFHYYHNIEGNSNSLIGNSVLSFCEDMKGNIWIGVDHAGLDCFNPKTQKFIHYQNNPFDKNSLSSDAVLCIQQDHSGILWIGTWGGGLNRFNPLTGKFKHYLPDPANPQSIGGMHIWSILEDKHKNLMLATHQEGLSYYIRNENRFVTYTNDPADSTTIVSNIPKKIYTDRDGVIWITTGNGLSKLDNDSFSFKNYLPVTYLNDIHDDGQGNLWIASYGIIKFNKKTHERHMFSFDKRMDNNLVTGILEDNRRNLWISVSNYGLLKVNLLNGKTKRYNLSDGLPSLSFNSFACLKLKDGRMLFGTKDGFFMFHPDSIREHYIPPRLVFTDFQIFNKSVKANPDSSVLKKHIAFTDTIILDYHQSVFSISYAALNYITPEVNNYAYKLEGFNDEWSYVGQKRDATYTNLNPGEYTFKVKVSVNENDWNNNELALVIIIKPPYYMTWWFRGAIIAIIIFILIAFYYIRLARIHRINTLLKQLVEERTAELASKNEILTQQANQLNETNTLLEERQMQIEEQTEELLVQKEELQKHHDNLNELNITKDKLFSILGHDLRAPFNSLIGFSELLYKNLRNYPIEKIETQIGYIYETARSTYYLLNNLLEWSRAQQGTIQFEPEIISVTELLRDEIRILEQQAKRKDIELNIMYEGPESHIEADRNLLSTVIRNLVSNAIKFSHKESEVNIILDFSDGQFNFAVRDSGVGMSPETIASLFKFTTNTSNRGTAGERGTGLGLLLCFDFIQKHNGKIWVESEVGKGSTFKFSIPAKVNF